MYIVTNSTHPTTSCQACHDCAAAAEAMAAATGSVGSTHIEAGPGGVVYHSATVTTQPKHSDLKWLAEEATRLRLRLEPDVEDAEDAVAKLELQLANAKAALAEVAHERDEALRAEEAAHQAVTDFEVAEFEVYIVQQDNN